MIFKYLIFSYITSSVVYSEDPISYAIAETAEELFVKNLIPLDIISSKSDHEFSSIITQIGKTIQNFPFRVIKYEGNWKRIEIGLRDTSGKKCQGICTSALFLLDSLDKFQNLFENHM
jgi:hypothetical protein